MESNSTASPEPTIIALNWRLEPQGAARAEKVIKEYLAENLVKPRLILDMAQCMYLGSSGLRVLLTTLKEIQKREGSLALCGLNPTVDEVFRFAGLETMFNIYATVEEAKAGS